MPTIYLLLALPVSAAALLYARVEYRQHGRLTWKGFTLLCLMVLLPNHVLGYGMRYALPSTPLEYLGYFVGLTGLVLMLMGILAFRSLAKVCCFDTATLTDAGPYQWGRNPQYVGLILFLLGFALFDWSHWRLAPLVVQAINLHLLVLVEEEHLRRVFGEPYIEFCRKTPRYWGWPTGAAAARD